MAEKFLPHTRAAAEQRGPTEHESEPVKVVRVFLFQSRTPDSIRDDEPLASISLTNMVLVQKRGDAANPNQLMPVGGKMHPGEHPAAAARRETVEETHLRPSQQSLQQCANRQAYSYTHGTDSSRQKRIAYIYTGKLSAPSYDVPAVLDPEEDKIERFVYLPLGEAEQLFATGQVQLDNTTYVIQDAFSPDATARALYHTDINDTQRQAVATELIGHHRAADARKKLSVLQALLEPSCDPALLSPAARIQLRNAGPASKIILQDQLNQLAIELTDPQIDTDVERQADVLQRFNALWQQQMAHCTHQDIRVALRYSDFDATIANVQSYKRRHDGRFESRYSERSGQDVPTMTLLLPLLMNSQLRADGRPDGHKIRTLYRNPTMRRLLAAFAYARTATQANPESDANQLITNLRERGLIRPELIANYDELASTVDNFFVHLRDEAGLTDEDAPIDQLNEIKGASLTRVVQIASMTTAEITHNFPRLHDPTDPGVGVAATAEMLQWEAARKLSLLMLLGDAWLLRTHAVDKGIEPILAAEQSFLDNTRLFGYRAGFEQYDRPGNAAKSLESLLRKIIERDKTLGAGDVMSSIGYDVFGTSYVFDDVPVPELTPRNISIPSDPSTGRVYSIRSDGRQLTSIFAPDVVAQLVFSYLEAGHGAIELFDYKPLPESGQPIQSNSAGGGGDVRYAKWYIQHTDPSGAQRFREVKVYVPDPTTGRTATEEYLRQEADHRDYRSKRLFFTGKTRSTIEALYPASIYNSPRPQISQMYTKRVS